MSFYRQALKIADMMSEPVASDLTARQVPIVTIVEPVRQVLAVPPGAAAPAHEGCGCGGSSTSIAASSAPVAPASAARPVSPSVLRLSSLANDEPRPRPTSLVKHSPVALSAPGQVLGLAPARRPAFARFTMESGKVASSALGPGSAGAEKLPHTKRRKPSQGLMIALGLAAVVLLLK